MARTKGYEEFRAEVLARPGAPARVAALRQQMLADLALYELRRSRAISQTEIADRLGVTQSAISKFEHASDCLISTLDEYVRALGGRLELRVWFDDGGTAEQALAAWEAGAESTPPRRSRPSG
jgi:transcriptional regulator with XRE-family HTH domain